jgi:hypothetical protein
MYSRVARAHLNYPSVLSVMITMLSSVAVRSLRYISAVNLGSTYTAAGVSVTRNVTK